jgi:hypothetical protein
MADPVAITSVVASATVAIVVPFISARLEQRRLQSQLTQERFAELRTLLDGAAARLFETMGVFVMVISARAGGSAQDRPIERLTELAVEVFRDNVRLSLRLGGGHDVVVTHMHAMQIVHEAEGKSRTQQTAPSAEEHASLGVAASDFLRAAGKIFAFPSQTSPKRPHLMRR